MYLSLFILKIFYLFTYLFGCKLFFSFYAYFFDCAMSYLGHADLRSLWQHAGSLVVVLVLR